MRLLGRASSGILVLFAVLLLLTAPAGAADLEGCQGTAASFDAAGGQIDTLQAPGLGGTQDDPFIVDWDGTVPWEGSSDSVIKNHSWTLSIFLIPIKSDGDPNDAGDTISEGTEKVSDDLPFRFAGLYYVSGSISGDGGASCSGSSWVKLAGSPVGTIPWDAGVVLTLVGLGLGYLSLPTVKPAAGAAPSPPAAPGGP
jgi:hypothetical protein